MKYTLKTADGNESIVTRDQLMVLWNNREVDNRSQAAPLGTAEWLPVGDVLGATAIGHVEPERVTGGTSADRASSNESSRSPQKGAAWNALADRYSDGYRVASAAVGIGQLLKGLAIVAVGAGLILAMSGVTSGIANDGPANLMRLGLGLGAAIIPASFLYALGVLVAAHGQVLKATLDTAVNTSPFLDDDQKARVLTL